jgi:type IV secretory pathway TrbD component
MWALVVLYHTVYGVFKAARATALALLVSGHEDRVLATGLLFGGRDLVAIVSGILAAWLYAAGHSWIAVVTAVLMMMLGVVLGRHGKEEPTEKGTVAAELADGWRYVLYDPAVRGFTVALFPIWAGMGGIMSTLVFLIISWWHGNAVVYGWGTSLLAAGGALGMFIGPLFTGKWPLSGLVRGFRFTLGIPALLFICFGGAPAWLPGLALLLVASTAFGANNSMEKALEQCLPVERWRAQAISAMSAIGTLGYIMGTVGAPLLLRFTNPPAVTVLCAVLIGVGAVFPNRPGTGMIMGEEPLAGCPMSETGLD